MARLDVLKNSLVKKESELERRFSSYFDDVKSANGQPLNDKRNGQVALNRWDRKNDAIRNQKESIEKTKRAIEIEEGKIAESQYWYEKMPIFIQKRIDDGTLTQWRKHPRMMFVKGVDGARIVYDDDTGLIGYRYLSKVPDQEQYTVFRNSFNSLNAEQKAIIENRNLSESACE